MNLRSLASIVFAVGSLLISVSAAHSQSQIQGTVHDAQSETPLPNANVFLEGTTHGTATDASGRFSLTEIEPGAYTLVVSMVGYATQRRAVQLYNSSGSGQATSETLTINLPRDVKELKGVSVKADRDEWLDRLDQFRSSFFGDIPPAAECSFINPEVLSLEKQENGLVAHAKEPLRIRNDALGYEITYHMTRYRAASDAWHRYGNFEFEPLEPDDAEQREEWREARERAYRGSFRHFVHALKSRSLEEEGFQVGLTATRSTHRGRHPSIQSEPEPVDPGRILEPAPSPNRTILTLPPTKYLEVEYVREGEAHQFARRYRRRSPQSTQTSWVQIAEGTYVLVSTQSGDFLRPGTPGFGYYVLSGYWGWYETAATVLPADYRPSDRR